MADTLKGRKCFVCATAQASDLANAAAYNALTWIEIKNVGRLGETGADTNILNYNELGTTVVQKQKGVTDAGNPEIEVARSKTDAGQIQLRTCAGTKLYYAFKWEDDDSGGSNPTRYFNRGLVVGPKRPNGGVEDFNVEIFQLGFVQLEIVQEAA